jgi:hypothetical protein
MDYQDFLEIIHDPEDPQHRDMLDWAGLKENQYWEDVHAFDVNDANRKVQKV